MTTAAGTRSGSSACVERAAAIAGAFASNDCVAPRGGDGFCVLAAECNELAARVSASESGRSRGGWGPASFGLTCLAGEGLGEDVNRALGGTAAEKAIPRNGGGSV
ncbi:MAG TPA: hypothetical protein VGV57_07015 [Thermoleophilaceae bacterium]|nr:hypothetical protein [Thermoleophilaceae bacterium]